jgi:ubiquinone/menaquinone biosynthesis C-methylase UbiE
MDAEKFWDNAAEKYAKSAIGNEKVYQEKLEATQKYFTAESDVLELACGTGTTSINHAPLVRHILATDISNSMLDIGRRKAREAGLENITFQQATVENLKAMPASFDVVLALNILHLIDDPVAAVNKVSALLKPGGFFISGTPCLGDVVFNYYRILIPILRLLGKAPPVHYVKRSELESSFADAGLEVAFQRPPSKGEVAFIIVKKLS